MKGQGDEQNREQAIAFTGREYIWIKMVYYRKGVFGHYRMYSTLPCYLESRHVKIYTDHIAFQRLHVLLR